MYAYLDVCVSHVFPHLCSYMTQRCQCCWLTNPDTEPFLTVCSDESHLCRCPATPDIQPFWFTHNRAAVPNPRALDQYRAARVEVRVWNLFIFIVNTISLGLPVLACCIYPGPNSVKILSDTKKVGYRCNWTYNLKKKTSNVQTEKM